MKKLIIFLMAFTAAMSISAQQLSQADQNKETVKKLIDNVNQKDWADQVQFIFPNSEAFESFRKVHAGFREVFPDYHFEIKTMFAHNDTVITLGIVSGTHSKVWDLFPNIPATNKKISWYETSVMILKDGKLVDGMILNDRLSILNELGYGCIPEPFKP